MQYFLGDIRNLEKGARQDAAKALREGKYDFHSDDLFKIALDLVCHAAVLRQERELTAKVPKIFGTRLTVLRAYSEHLEEVEELRRKLRKQGFDYREIEQLAQTSS